MIDFQFMVSNELILAQEYLMARSDLSNVSSDLSSTENLLDSTDDASFPDTDEVSYCVIIFCYFQLLLSKRNSGFANVGYFFYR